MFVDLIKSLCAIYGISKNALGERLGYKSASAFQKVNGGKDIRLSVLLDICEELGFIITIKNGQGVEINLNDYYKQHKPTPAEK